MIFTNLRCVSEMNLSKRIFLCLCLCLLFSAARAQYRFDSWTADETLPQNSVRAMLQTSDGYFWLTTLDGLVRFDGIRFTVFNKSNSKSLPGNRFINLFSEPDDTLWISTEEQGVIRFQGGEFYTFTTADGLPSDHVFEMFGEIDGTLTAFTSKGSAKFDGTHFINALSEPETIKFKRLYAPSGKLWEINKTALTAEKDGQKNSYELPTEVKKDFEAEHNLFIAIKLFEDAEGDLWFSFNQFDRSFKNSRLFRLSNAKLEEIIAENMPRSLVFDIKEDRNGNLWLATQEDGACRLSENRFTCYTPENEFPSRFVRTMLKDREGTLWLTTDDKGIYRLYEQFITPLSTAQGLTEKNVYAILEDRSGAVWIGSHGALARYKDGKFTNYKRGDGLKYVDVQSLFEDQDGRLWIGSLDGVVYFENGKFHDFRDNFPKQPTDTAVHDIHQDRQGNLWFATNYGLYKYDGSSITVLTTADGLPGDNVKTILENDDGSFWLATYSGIALFKDGKFTNYTEENGLAGNHVRALYKDETGTLWIGTYDSGLSRFKDEKFTNYTIENGLPSNGAFQILEDAGRNFWMTSNQGIYRVSRAHLEEFAEGKRQIVPSTLFGKTDGMLSAEANGGGQPAGIKTKDGRFWFPTQDGAAIIDTEKVKLNPLPPPVVIEEARIDNQKIESLKNEIKLVPGQENLEIDYTGLSFIKPEQVQFRYRLEGLEDDWTEAKNRRTAFYPHLSPGNYVFRVIAANSDNVWNEQGATMKVVVLPPFYQTRLFIVAAVAVALLMIYAIYRARVSRLERARAAQEEFSRRLINAHETERRRIAAGLHDSLGQQLLVIKNWAALELNVLPPENSSREALDEISATASQAVEEVREIIYDLRPYQLDKIGLKNTIWFMIEKIAAASGIEFQTDIGEINDLFAPEAEIALYRVVQECVNNIVKHSGATRATVLIERKEKSVKLTIEDDGRGFDADGENGRGKGFGLEGLAERVRILGGTMAIQSATDTGTKIQIEILTGAQASRLQ